MKGGHLLPASFRPLQCFFSSRFRHTARRSPAACSLADFDSALSSLFPLSLPLVLSNLALIFPPLLKKKKKKLSRIHRLRRHQDPGALDAPRCRQGRQPHRQALQLDADDDALRADRQGVRRVPGQEQPDLGATAGEPRPQVDPQAALRQEGCYQGEEEGTRTFSPLFLRVFFGAESLRRSCRRRASPSRLRTRSRCPFLPGSLPLRPARSRRCRRGR